MSGRPIGKGTLLHANGISAAPDAVALPACRLSIDGPRDGDGPRAKGSLRFFLSAAFVLAISGVAAGLAVRHSATNSTVVREYYPTGVLATESMVDRFGKPDGTLREWYEDGTLKREGIFSHGEIVKVRSYYPSGRLRLERFEGRNYELVTIEHPDE